MGLRRHCGASELAEAVYDNYTTVIRKRIASLMNRIRGNSNSLLQTRAARLDTDSVIMQYWIRLKLEKIVNFIVIFLFKFITNMGGF